MRVHAFCSLSNHFHLVLSDPGAVLPEFMQILDGLLARTLNVYHGRRENFWAPGNYTAVRLVERKDVFRKLVYTLTNPVEAGLVAFASEWPGPGTAPGQVGKAKYEAKRPSFFFGDTMPEKTTLELAPPPLVSSQDPADPGDSETDSVVLSMVANYSLAGKMNRRNSSPRNLAHLARRRFGSVPRSWYARGVTVKRLTSADYQDVVAVLFVLGFLLCGRAPSAALLIGDGARSIRTHSSRDAMSCSPVASRFARDTIGQIRSRT